MSENTIQKAAYNDSSPVYGDSFSPVP